MIRRSSIAFALLVCALALAPSSAPAEAPEAPAWRLTMTAMPSNFAPGATTEYFLVATNVGAKATAATPPAILKATLPAGLKPLSATAKSYDPEAGSPPTCGSPTGQSIACESTGALHPGRQLTMTIEVEVPPSTEEGELLAQASVEGGGAGQGVSVSVPTAISASPVPFDFLPGFSAPADNPDGTPTVLSGAHPYQLTTNLGFPTERLGNELTGTEHPRDLHLDLPRGLLGDPTAVSEQCTEAELISESSPGCPLGSQVGSVEVTSLLGGVGTVGAPSTPLFEMVPPPGSPAEFGFDADGVGLFIHAIAGVRTDSDYGAYATSNDLLALGSHPIFNLQVQLWGDPSGKAHDRVRGDACGKDGHNFKGEPCSAAEQMIPFLTLPGDCPGEPLGFEAFADSWEQPGLFHETSYESADLQGATAHVEDCGAIEYEPSIESQPTTNIADSPAGLDFKLHQPQSEPEEEPLTGRATPILKDATVTFPAGMTVNPSQASGLGACSEEEIGFQGEREGVLSFSKSPQSCPDAAKIATLTATTPLLGEYNEVTHAPVRNPQTGAGVPRPLHGSVYLAKPFANPFGSLAAVYFAIEDERTGIVAKLAGEGELDPGTGQITVRTRQTPELPIEDLRVHVFGGDRGAFITPPTCATQETATELVPWSAPEALPAHPGDPFTPTSAPGGGPCPQAQSQMPNAPTLTAGTLSPQAGKYSTLLFRLSRQDGSQRISKVEATLPPGLTAKLAGVGQCSEADIAKARSREAPDQGATEIADPSCPASSQVGTVDAAVGAGSSPYHAAGKVYLAGPYRDAPLSFVIIAPAVAGPFDLGTVVTRVAVYLDPETARPRAVSDPIPQFIEGVPLDVRAVTMRIDRPNFILNPTSCDEESFAGSVTSALGQVAPLSERFQASGCAALPYEPGLSARLKGPTHRGAHPSLRTVFSAKPGETNTARLSFALPHSEFIDQAHFRTICTRVQFAAKACPAGSVYGQAKVVTPLLDQPLEGPVYLRSSSNELPDVVFALHGPPSMPIEVDLDGRVDSVHGGIRFVFDAVPDAPLTEATVTAQGAKKGLFQNSTELCRATHRITLKLDGQNGKTHDIRPRLRAKCAAKKGHNHKHKGAHR